jgi:hypothetical protein
VVAAAALVVERQITGEMKSKVDAVWDALWTGGISNPLEVMEQITYLLFIRRLDPIPAPSRFRNHRVCLRCPRLLSASAIACSNTSANHPDMTHLLQPVSKGNGRR